MRIDHISLSYGHRLILDDISLDIPRGDFVFLIGHSGSGKTSFVNMLIGAIKPQSGDIFSDDGLSIVHATSSQLQAYRRSIGVVFQDYKLLPRKTVEENVAFALEVS